jgi:hypothetical protein
MFMEYKKRKERRGTKEDPNPVGDLSLLESPRKNVINEERMGISKEIERNREREKQRN